MDGWWAVSAYWSWGGPSDSRQPLLTARPDRPTDDPPTAPATRRAIQPGGTLSTPTTRAVASALGGARVLAGLGEFVPSVCTSVIWMGRASNTDRPPTVPRTSGRKPEPV